MEKPVRLYFCPKCKSKDVGYVHDVRSLFGILPTMRCKDCGYKAPIFPIVFVNKRMHLEYKLENLEREIKAGVESEKVVGKVAKKKELKKDILDDMCLKKKKKTKKKVKKK